MRSVAISADGEYIVASSSFIFDSKQYLFDKDSSTPLWNYTTGGWVYSVAISADGEYIVTGDRFFVSLFDKTPGQGGGGGDGEGSAKVTEDDDDGHSDDDDGSLPALSVITSIAAVAVIALRRRY